MPEGSESGSGPLDLVVPDVNAQRHVVRRHPKTRHCRARGRPAPGTTATPGLPAVAAIQEIAKQVRLGKELRLDADEFVRRAERGLGVGIRHGQSRGDIASAVEVASAAGKVARGLFTSRQNALTKPADTDFAARSELSGNGTKGQYGIYGMTDGVSDEQFEDAIAEARAEGNLSRANVARKAKAKATAVIDADDPLIDAEVEAAPADR